MMKRMAATAVISIAIPLAGAVAEPLSPAPVFEGSTTTPAKTGAVQPVQVSVQLWKIAGRNGATQEMPLRGFYIAHLLAGQVSSTIDQRSTQRAPGDYWTVKVGSAMQIKVLGEFAVLETIVVRK